MDKGKITETSSRTKFRFGDGRVYTAMKKLNVPAEIGNQKVMIAYHVINAELPMLLSKSGMRAAGTVIDFKEEKIKMFGKQIQLGFTSSGHYTIPLTPKVRAAADTKEVKVFFNVKELSDKTIEDKKRMMNKVHKTFGHPSAERLKKLIKEGGIEDSEINK